MNCLRLSNLFKLLALCLALVSANASASDLIASRAYFEDAAASRSFDQVKEEVFTPYDGVLSRGYTKSATWIRLEISPSPRDDQVVLLIKPVYLDQITLFDPLDLRGTERAAGDTTSFDTQEYKTLYHAFVLSAVNKPRVVWLRVATTSTTTVVIEALPRTEMVENQFQELLFEFCVLAIMGMFVLHGLINWFNHREPLYALFVTRQVYLFFYTATLFGLHRYLLHKFVNPLQLDLLYSYFVVGATAISLVFERKFQLEYMLNKFGRYVLNVLMVWIVVVCMAMAFGATMIALRLNMLLNAVGLIALLLIAIFCIDRQKIERSVDVKLLDKTLVVGYYAIINVVLLGSALSFLGVTQANHYTVNILIYYTLIAGALMTILMQLRTNKLIKAHNDYEHGLSLSQQQVAMEKARREEQAHLLHMLMHELKNPLAIIEMAQHADNDKETTISYISRSVKNMNDVIDRCVKADRLSEGNVQTYIEQVDLYDFVVKCLAERDPDEHDIKLICGNELNVKTDQQLLKVMINNLLDNAIRYGDPAAPVEVAAYQKVDVEGVNGVAITISNRPSVVSWPDTDKVFSKYYRSEGAKAKSGTGLGLYLVRTLARLLGGECRYIPDEKFIKFELWLPS